MNPVAKTDSNVIGGSESNLAESIIHNLARSTEALVTKRFKKGKWTKEEDETLKRVVGLLGERKWKKISQFVVGRSPIQCLHRWNKILKPGLVKGPWSLEEDQKLMDWVKKEGPRKWSQCSKLIPGRSGKQCRERWLNNLNPGIKRGNWNDEEDERLFRLFLKHGSSWSKIAKHFEGRTENCIKNRYYSTMRKVKAAKVKKEGPSETTSVVGQMTREMEEEEQKEQQPQAAKSKEETPTVDKEAVNKTEEVSKISISMPNTSPAPSVTNQKDKLSSYLSTFLQKFEHLRNDDRFSVAESESQRRSDDEGNALSERYGDDFGQRPKKKVNTGENIKIPIIKIEQNASILLQSDADKASNNVKEEPDSSVGLERRRRTSRTKTGPSRIDIEQVTAPANFGGVFAPVAKKEERSPRASSVSSVNNSNNIDKMKMQIQEYCQKFIKNGQPKPNESDVRMLSGIVETTKTTPNIAELFSGTAGVPSMFVNAPPAPRSEGDAETLNMFQFLTNQLNGAHEAVANENAQQFGNETVTASESKKAKLMTLVQHIMLLESLLKKTKRELLMLEHNFLVSDGGPLLAGGLQQQGNIETASQGNKARAENFLECLSIFSKNEDKLF